jgi:hypothetical protein
MLPVLADEEPRTAPTPLTTAAAPVLR